MNNLAHVWSGMGVFKQSRVGHVDQHPKLVQIHKMTIRVRITINEVIIIIRVKVKLKLGVQQHPEQNLAVTAHSPVASPLCQREGAL